MHRFVLLSLLALSALSSRAQPGKGQVVFANRVTGVLDAPVVFPDGLGAGAIPAMIGQLFLVRDGQLIALESKLHFARSRWLVSLTWTGKQR